MILNIIEYTSENELLLLYNFFILHFDLFSFIFNFNVSIEISSVGTVYYWLHETERFTYEHLTFTALAILYAIYLEI